MKFILADFDIKTGNDKKRVREKMDSLSKLLLPYAKSACPKTYWDYYVTKSPMRKDEWGGLYPMLVKGCEDYISSCANVFFNIPQEGENLIVAANMEFQGPRNKFVEKCLTGSLVSRLNALIQGAPDAKVVIGQKEVRRDDNRQYTWLDTLWDSGVPAIWGKDCTTQYLQKAAASIDSMSKNVHPDTDMKYEPFVLIKYDIDIHTIIGRNDPECLIGQKMQLLAPIVEFIMQ